MSAFSDDALEHVKVDIERRKFNCNGGKNLRIDQLAEPLRQIRLEISLEYIDESVMIKAQG